MRDADTPTVDKASKDNEHIEPRGMSPTRAAQYWSKQIDVATRDQKDYWNEAQTVVQAYRNGKHGASKQGTLRKRYNILYSNTETQRGALYAKSGKPDIRQRWSSQDQMARSMSEILERSITVGIDSRAYETAHEAGVLLGLLAGRAVMRFDIASETAMVPVPSVEPMMGADGKPSMMERVSHQKIDRTLVGISDFLHSPAETWREVWWIAFRHKFNREDMKSHKFAEAKGIPVPLNYRPDHGDGKPSDEADDDVSRAEVFELWSLTHKQRFWIVKDYPIALRIDDDPLELQNFWPMQEPLEFHPSIGGTMLPQLDWWQYERLANDLEETNGRIAALTKALKYRGVRDASVKELAKLATAPDNTFVPVENYAQFVGKGGLAQSMEALPIKDLAATLIEALKASAELENRIDRMTGIADIMRGDSDANETATAQNIKAQYGGIRIKLRQRAVQAWIRDGMRLESELIAEHFEPDVLAAMTGLEVTEEIMQALRDDKLRSFRIDVETDSTVFEDAEAQKEANAAVINTAVQLMETGMQVMQAEPEMGEVVFEMLSMSLRSMKGGRNLEDVIDRARTQRQQRMEQQSQQPPPPDPRAVAAQAQAEAVQAKAQVDMQSSQIRSQADAQKLGREMQRDAAQHEQTMQKMEADGHLTKIKTSAAIAQARAKKVAASKSNGAHN
jgi:hypothetical protein